jgi:hypothetical protein
MVDGREHLDLIEDAARGRAPRHGRRRRVVGTGRRRRPGDAARLRAGEGRTFL